MYIQHPLSALLLPLFFIFVVGLMLRAVKSQPILIISSFEVPSITSEQLKVTGLTVAHLLLDEIGNIEKEVISMKGRSDRHITHYVEYDRIIAQSNPNPTTVGIEIGGLSWDRITYEWERIRNKYNPVSGDLVIDANVLSMYARIPNYGSWGAGPYPVNKQGLKDACSELALNLLSDYKPQVAGLFYQKYEETDKARDIYLKWRDREPDDPLPYFYLGLSYWKSYDFDKAISCLHKATRIKENFFEAWNNLGIAYYEKQDSSNAISAYKKALQYRPKYPEALINLGDVLAEEGDEKAIEVYQRALKLRPNNQKVLIKLGEALSFFGDYKEALIAYQKANAIAANDYTAMIKIGDLYRILGDNKRGSAWTQNALHYRPDYQEPIHRLTRAELKFGNPGGAGTVLIKKYFIISHRSDWKIPEWVIHQLSPGDLQGPAERRDDFRPDASVPFGQRAELSDYEYSGFDRGHMAPPGDFTRSWMAMSECFLLSNIAPQVGVGFNRNVWAELERAVRGWVEQRGTLTIITGPVVSYGEYTADYSVIGPNKVAVPTHFYKIVVDENNPDGLEILAFMLPNEDLSLQHYSDYLTSIDEIERAARLDFLSALPDTIEDELESTIASKIW